MIPYAKLFAFTFLLMGCFANPSFAQPSESEMITPQKRLADAEVAFRAADYGKLVPLLDGIAGSSSLLTTTEARTSARRLLGVGYFFEAQRATNSNRRTALLQSAKDIFWILLQEEPTHRLDTFLFPASVVEIFDDVRSEHAAEIEVLVKKRNNDSEEPTPSDVLYIERNVERGLWGLNFLPFGVGQFQNEQSVKGTLFFIAQALSLTVNIGSFLAIESLRDRETGKFSTEPDGGNFATAILWRRIMYGALGAFALSYAGSVWDGLRFFQEQRVRIRSLDEAPPELNPNGASTGNGLKLPLGLGFEWSF